MSTADPDPRMREALRRSEQALRLACASLPHLSGLARVVRLKASRRIPVAAVTASGLVLVNPDEFAPMPLGDAAFILAHELLHLALDTHGRRGDSDPLLVNYAHDYIINDILSVELDRRPPLGGLEFPSARLRSLEEMVVALRDDEGDRSAPPRCWTPEGPPGRRAVGRAGPPTPSPMSRALRDAGLLSDESEREPEPEPSDRADRGPAPDDPLDRGDVIPPERESEFDPDLSDVERRGRRERVRREAARAASLGTLADRLDALGTPSPQAAPERGEGLIRAVRDRYATPWELALQHWMDAVAPGPRSYLRPSRRGADRTDCVLAGRKREGWTLHIVLDTSGSMVDALPRALGAIASFCEGSGVAEAHILQCDVEVTHDDWVAPEALAEYRVAGFGGSDMTPALLHLVDDPEVASALVLTDGYIDYPADEPPFRVLWVLIGSSSDDFDPPYGITIRMALD